MDELAGKEEQLMPAEEITELWWRKNKQEIKKNIPLLYNHLDRLYCQMNQKVPAWLDWDRMLALFRENVTLRNNIGNEPISKKSADNYCTWLRKLNKASKENVLFWILYGLSASDVSWEREQIAWRHLEDFLKTLPWSNNDKSNVQSAYRKFVKFVMSYFDGNLSVSFVLEDFFISHFGCTHRYIREPGNRGQGQERGTWQQGEQEKQWKQICFMGLHEEQARA